MLVQLMPEQITERWDIIGGIIENCLPPVTNGTVDRMVNILERLLKGEMQCWVGYEAKEPIVLVITTEVRDAAGSSRDLLIYVFYGIAPLNAEQYLAIYNQLRVYSKSMGMNRITFYTNVERIRRMVKGMGGSVEWTYGIMEV